MSRIRTGLTPDDWRIEGPSSGLSHGYLNSAARHGYALTGGALVQGEPGIVERDRQATKRANHKARHP